MVIKEKIWLNTINMSFYLPGLVLKRRIVVFSEDGFWTRPTELIKREKPLVLVTHDKSILSANDRKKRVWKEKRESPLRPKEKRKRIMVSEFLIPIGILSVFDSIPNHQLLLDKDWPLDENQNPRCYCTELLEYDKNNY